MSATKARNPRVSLRVLFHSPGNFLAFGCGAGLAPIAPGTCGSLLAIPFFLLLHPLEPMFYAGAVVIAFLVGIPLCAAAARSMDTHDHPAIVWDEMVGMWIALFFIPFSWFAVVLGFVLFRLFDIVKPWPINAMDRRLRGGLGIMLDDVLAGIFANVALRLLLPLQTWF